MSEKLKIIMPSEIELGKDFTARVEKVRDPTTPSWPGGTLLRASTDYKVYYLQNFERRWITTGEIFDKMALDLHFSREDIKVRPQGELDAIRKGKDINKWPEEDIIEPGEWSWVKGLLTEGTVPSLSQIVGMNFNLVMPFGWVGHEAKLKKLADSGIGLIPKANQLPQPLSTTYEKRYNIKAYFIYDEPEFIYRPESLVKRAKKLHAKTDLPITINFTTAFWINDPSWMKGDWYLKYPEVFAELDFISIDSYWYRAGGFYQVEYDRAMEAMRRIRAEGKSILGIGQGHEDPLNNITKPDMQEIAQSWKREGAGNIWYLWECVRQGNSYPSIGSRPGDSWYNEQVKAINR